jgi:ribonucleoside-diphosphate reductase beta chain
VCALYEEELPARAAALAAGTTGLDGAVGLYHLVLEGVAFHAGQQALLTLLDETATLPGVREGVARVQGDERWHVGLGVRCLQDLGRPAADELDALAARAATCWPAAVDATAALAVHRRRLGVLAGGVAQSAPWPTEPGPRADTLAPCADSAAFSPSRS